MKSKKGKVLNGNRKQPPSTVLIVPPLQTSLRPDPALTASAPLG
jgi:hypothetical protein